MRKKMILSAVLAAVLILSDGAGGCAYASGNRATKTQITAVPTGTIVAALPGSAAQENPRSTAGQKAEPQDDPKPTDVQMAEPQASPKFTAGQKADLQDGEDATPKAPDSISEEDLAAYYKDAVFIGDSIMLGFRNYCKKTDETSFLHDIQFLAAGSYSAFNAMKPVAGDNVHPLYKGKKYQIWDALSLMNAKRAFILLGMNDISILGLEGARDTYKELIGQIKETCPDIEIHILSITYTLKDKGKGKLNNNNIAEYNTLLQEMVADNGWGYMDVCTPLDDGDGNLAEDYCSDGFVHLSPAAYDIWATILTNYASVQEEEGMVSASPERVYAKGSGANETGASSASSAKPKSSPKR